MLAIVFFSLRVLLKKKKKRNIQGFPYNYDFPGGFLTEPIRLTQDGRNQRYYIT